MKTMMYRNERIKGEGDFQGFSPHHGRVKTQQMLEGGDYTRSAACTSGGPAAGRISLRVRKGA